MSDSTKKNNQAKPQPYSKQTYATATYAGATYAGSDFVSTATAAQNLIGKINVRDAVIMVIGDSDRATKFRNAFKPAGFKLTPQQDNVAVDCLVCFDEIPPDLKQAKLLVLNLKEDCPSLIEKIKNDLSSKIADGLFFAWSFEQEESEKKEPTELKYTPRVLKGVDTECFDVARSLYSPIFYKLSNS